MKALLVSTDLLVASRVEHAAARAGALLAVARDVEAAVDVMSRGPVDVVILDLVSTPPDVEEDVQRLRQAVDNQERTVAQFVDRASHVADHAAVTLVAFAPHVHEARLEAARRAGCDRVVSRGQFFRTMADFFAAAAG